jgi:hypothetical protein
LHHCRTDIKGDTSHLEQILSEQPQLDNQDIVNLDCDLAENNNMAYSRSKPARYAASPKGIVARIFLQTPF